MGSLKTRRKKRRRKIKSRMMKMRMMLLIRLTKCWITSFGTKTWRTWSKKRMKITKTMINRIRKKSTSETVRWTNRIRWTSKTRSWRPVTMMSNRMRSRAKAQTMKKKR
jgi:hypothetical protein